MKHHTDIRVYRNTVTGEWHAFIPGTTHGYVTGATYADMLRQLAGAVEEVPA